MDIISCCIEYAHYIWIAIVNARSEDIMAHNGLSPRVQPKEKDHFLTIISKASKH